MKFSMNYPSNWTVGKETTVSTGTEIEFSGNEGEKVGIRYGCYYNQDWKRNYTLKEWIYSQRKWFKKYHRQVEEKIARLGGTDAVDFTYMENGRTVREIYCGKGDSIYTIEISSGPARDDFNLRGSSFILGTLTIDAIRTGKVKIDMEQLERIQKYVDDGHEPWMMNPLMVLMSGMYSCGFDPGTDRIADPQGIAQSMSVEDVKEITLEVTHMGKVYRAIMIQPVRGPGKVWALSDVEEK